MNNKLQNIHCFNFFQNKSNTLFKCLWIKYTSIIENRENFMSNSSKHILYIKSNVYF